MPIPYIGAPLPKIWGNENLNVKLEQTVGLALSCWVCTDNLHHGITDVLPRPPRPTPKGIPSYPLYMGSQFEGKLTCPSAMLGFLTFLSKFFH